MAHHETSKGIEWTTSWDKVVLDMHIGSLVLRPAAWLEYATEDRLGDGYYIDQRIQPDGTVAEVRKLKTMRDADDTSPTDMAIGFNKNNPRIASRFAAVIRDIGLDELPQLRLVPQWSIVGPREHNPNFRNYAMNILWQADPGLARDYRQQIAENPEVRSGFVSPGTLYMKRTTERGRDVVMEIVKRDLRYFTEQASPAGDLRMVAQTPAVLLYTALKNRLIRQTPTPVVPDAQPATRSELLPSLPRPIGR